MGELDAYGKLKDKKALGYRDLHAWEDVDWFKSFVIKYQLSFSNQVQFNYQSHNCQGL
jgi:hypothetical protein